jgi:hypothetical protein
MVGYHDSLGDTITAIQKIDRALQQSEQVLVSFANSTRLVFMAVPNLAKVAVGSVAAALHASVAMAMQAINQLLAQVSMAMQRLPVPNFMKQGAIGLHGFGLNFQAMATMDSNAAGEIAGQGVRGIQADWNRLMTPISRANFGGGGASFPMGEGAGGGGGKAGSRGRSGGGAVARDPLADAKGRFKVEGIQFGETAKLIKEAKTLLDAGRVSVAEYTARVSQLDEQLLASVATFTSNNDAVKAWHKSIDDAYEGTVKLLEADQEALEFKQALQKETEALALENYFNTESIGKNTEALDMVRQTALLAGQEFSNMVATGQLSFAQLSQAILRDLVRVTTQLLIVQPLMRSIFGGGAIGQAFSGFGNQLKGLPTALPEIRGFANGGITPANKPFIVGEKGPELMQLGTQAHVTPNHALGGSNVTVNVIGAPEGTKVRESQAGGQRMIDVIIGEVASQINRGQGAIPKAMTSRFGLNASRGLA